MDGLLLVDKPSGPTSYDVIRVVKRSIKGTKIGHCGTLDPIASGLLILLFGKWTKKQALYMGQDKIYKAQILLGTKTDSGDITGTVIQTAPVSSLQQDHISMAIQPLLGEREQLPPMYSAIKVNGTPLYKLARKGHVVERKSRLVRIHSIDVLNISSPNTIEVRVHCSSGTYIRSLSEEVGNALGTVATMKSLVREKIGDFSIQEAVPGSSLFGMSEGQIQEKVRLVS